MYISSEPIVGSKIMHCIDQQMYAYNSNLNIFFNSQSRGLFRMPYF